MAKRYKFTDEQEIAIGHVMVDNWGANVQTGFNPDGIPYIYAQLGPQLPMKYYSISEDGTVMVGGSSAD